jgi:hypothetical protein
MPPPIDADPWASVVEPEGNGSGTEIADNGVA